MTFLFIQLAHGADPTMKNQEGQTPLDLSTADDVRSLLLDALPLNALKSASPTTTATTPAQQTINPGIRTAGMGVSAPVSTNFRPATAPAIVGANKASSGTISSTASASSGIGAVSGGSGGIGAVGASGGVGAVGASKGISGAVGGASAASPVGLHGDGALTSERMAVEGSNPMDISVSSFLSNLQLDHLRDIFEKEQVRIKYHYLILFYLI